MKRFWCTRCGGWQHAVISVNKLTVIIPSNGLKEKKQQNEWRRSAERLSVMSLRMNYSLFESEWVQMCVVLSGFWRFFFPPPEKHVFRSLKTSRVTRVTLVLWIGNETLRASRFGNASCVTNVWSPYRITPIHWLMAWCRLWRNHVVSLYWRMRHPLLRFLCRKEPCRQREELGSIRSVSFPIQIGNDIPNTSSWKRCLSGPIMNQQHMERFKQTRSENLEPYQRQGCRTWQRFAERTILPQHKYLPGVPL